MFCSKMTRLASLTLLGGATLFAQGCTQLRSHQGYIGDQTLLSSVQPGVDNKQSVEASLGRNTSFFEELFGNIGAVGAPGAGGGGANGPN